MGELRNWSPINLENAQYAIIGPRWNLNANNTLYVTRGEGRAQVVGDQGKTVFDEVLQRGQILVIQQGYAVVVKAGKQGIEWVDVKTNDNAITSPVAGRTLVLRAIPVEVLANAYDISREEAFRLKTGRREIENGETSTGSSDFSPWGWSLIFLSFWSLEGTPSEAMDLFMRYRE